MVMDMDMTLCPDLDEGDGNGPSPTPTPGASGSRAQRDQDDEDEDEEDEEDEETRSPCARVSGIGTGSDGDVSDASDDGDHAAIVTAVRPSAAAAASTVVAFPLFSFSRAQAQTRCQAGAVVAATDPDTPELAAVHDPRRVKVNKKREPPSTETQASVPVQRSSGAPKKKNCGRRERSDKLTPQKQASTELCQANFIFPSTTLPDSVYCTLCSSSFACDTYSVHRHVVNSSHSQRMREKVKELSDSKKTSQQIMDFFARPDHESIQGARLAPDIQTFRCLCLPPPPFPCYILTRVLM